MNDLSNFRFRAGMHKLPWEILERMREICARMDKLTVRSPLQLSNVGSNPTLSMRRESGQEYDGPYKLWVTGSSLKGNLMVYVGEPDRVEYVSINGYDLSWTGPVSYQLNSGPIRGGYLDVFLQVGKYKENGVNKCNKYLLINTSHTATGPVVSIGPPIMECGTMHVGRLHFQPAWTGNHITHIDQLQRTNWNMWTAPRKFEYDYGLERLYVYGPYGGLTKTIVPGGGLAFGLSAAGELETTDNGNKRFGTWPIGYIQTTSYEEWRGFEYQIQWTYDTVPQGESV